MIVTFLAAAFFQAAVPPAAAHIDPRRDGPGAVRDSLEAAELRFFHEWREAFRLTEDARHPRPTPQASLAARANAKLHETYALCHGPTERPATLSIWDVVPVGPGLYKACPAWRLSDSLPSDERRQTDAALDDRFIGPVRLARASLIGQFNVGARALPANEWIAGQRVRLLLDQQEWDRAFAAAKECAGAQSWCRLLEGLVHSYRGSIMAADSVFRIALRELPLAERCRWEDIAVLLDSAARGAYARMPCQQRDSLNTILWWLADPLWIEPGNERWEEHIARQVIVRLRREATRDERYDWRADNAGDALAEMVVRYGWPTYTYWPGQWVDYTRSAYLTMHSSSPSSPYTTFEYSGGRLRTVPSWQTLVDPFHSTAADWRVGDPHTGNRGPLAPGDNELDRAVNDLHSHVSAWWPQEHFLPHAPIVDLTPGQVAILRRQEGSLLATATGLDSASLQRPGTASVDATLFVGNHPDSTAGSCQ